MEAKSQISHAQEFQINCVLKEGEHNSPLLKWRLHIVTSFQRGQKGTRGKSHFIMEKPDTHGLGQVIKVNISSKKPC